MCDLFPIWYVVLDFILRTQRSYFITPIAHTTGDMATPLRKVSENYHLTMKRAHIATTVSPYPYLPEASSERSESARASHIGVGFSLLSADNR
jgi:hypothetical protein